MKIHFLKTIWSDIIILEHNGETALIDSGFESQYEQLREYLQGLGVSEISFVLLTHFHRDHYGSIPLLLGDFRVKRVYLKEYSGLDCTTAWGTEADDDYRREQMCLYHEMQELIRGSSELIQAEEVSSVPFGPYELKLYFNENSVREIYEDKDCPETCGRIMFSENQNSMGIFMEADGLNIFFGGDLMDIPSAHPKADHVVCQIAKKIGRQIDIYKVPHHGTVNTGCMDALQIFRPKLAVITNEDAYLSEHSDVYVNIRRANPHARIMLTENDNVVIDTADFLY
ncbi:MAG: MBL fold metallo-hydrolase [Huintestinicola sp.]